ncbi:amidohydrolase family protein [Evansella sp. LMS18]|uniref:amidohydrolase family protein n=1 Tax=Evansella sp. LMS18 TaxID=2924033 RepID=UPI0020D05750|nr:amidohydrolase family protein [Evansella sp. LMS18]UTR12344.1 amidohydrolase family protein [Evansella sp. LMS18]
MLPEKFHLRHTAIILVPLAVLAVIAGLLINTGATEESAAGMYAEKGFDPIIDPVYAEVLAYSENPLVDISIKGNQAALLFYNEQTENLEAGYGNLADNLQDVKLVDKFSGEGGANGYITWIPSADDFLITYFSDERWNVDKYSMEQNTKESIASFGSGELRSSPVFADDKDRFFYTQPLPGESSMTTLRMNNFLFDGPLDIFQMNGPVPDIDYMTEIDVSLDNNKFAYTVVDEESGAHSLRVFDTSAAAEITISEQGKDTGEPAWSKDGNLLAYTQKDKEGSKAIYIYNLSSAEVWQITKSEGLSSNPVWLDSGELILSSKAEGNYQIYKVDIAKAYKKESGEKQTPVTGYAGTLYDSVILNGTVIDPESETYKFGYNIGIKDGVIAVITKEEINGEETINADGKLVTPGFIDILSFNPNGAGEHFKVMDGVTTHLGMHGAGIEFKSMFNNLEKRGMINHFGGAIQHSHMRTRLNIGRYDPASEAQIDQMRAMTKRAAEEGAIGISFSPEYYPGMTGEEILAVMEAGKKYNLVSFFHVRYSTMYDEKTNLDAIEEVIGYARELQVPVQIQHINSTGGTFSMAESLKMIDEARSEGLDITIDLYPYDYWATWANTARFDEGFKERFQIDYGDLQVANSTERLTEDSFAQYRNQRTLLIAYGIPEEDVKLAMKPDYAMIGSDTIMVPPDFNNHPRGSGTFARTYSKYVKETETIPFMKALQMMTVNPVERLQEAAPDLRNKGRLQEGMDADINVIDYEKLRDTATPEKVASYSEGIEYVLVDGKIVKDQSGIRDGILPGKTIRSEF